jgi:hypothetical protein
LTQLAIGLGLALFPKQIRQLSNVRGNPSRLILRQQLRRWSDALGNNSGDCASSLTPSSPRNSIPCSSKTCRIVLRVRACIEGVPLTCSPRAIADFETPHWSDSLRTDHFSNARAERICAPLIGGMELKFPATRLFLAVSLSQ